MKSIISFLSIVVHWQNLIVVGTEIHEQPFYEFEGNKIAKGIDILSANNTRFREEIPGFLVDGNHPDKITRLTHYHVDGLIGTVPPTKRVKKILTNYNEGISKKKTVVKRQISEKEIPANMIAAEKQMQKQSEHEPNSFSEGNHVEKPGEGRNASLWNKIFPFSSPIRFLRIRKVKLSNEKPKKFYSENRSFRRMVKLFHRPIEYREKGMNSALTEKVKMVEGQNGGNKKYRKVNWAYDKEGEEDFKSNKGDDSSVDFGKNFHPKTASLFNTETKTLRNYFYAEKKAELASNSAELKLEHSKEGKNPSSRASFRSSGKKYKKPKKIPNENKFNHETENGAEESTDSFFSTRGGRSVRESGEKRLVPLDRRKIIGKPARWYYLFLLAGNSSFIKGRIKDFAGYIKRNLAARLNLEYDDVEVDNVVLSFPTILVNATVFENFKDGGGKREFRRSMGQANATLLDLSGLEYRVVLFFRNFEAPKELRPKTPPPEGLEFIAYAFFGSGCACLIVLTFLITVNGYLRKVSDEDSPRMQVKPVALVLAEDEESSKKDPEATIYS